MEAPMESPSQVDDLVFRASKRRKTNRIRADSKLDEEPVTHIEQPDEQPRHEPPVPEESDHEELGLNYVIRARKQQQRRRGGIEFSATRPAFDDGPSKAEAQARDVAATTQNEMSNRFATQTGYKAQVDQHMMAYVDAELAKRKTASSSQRDVPDSDSDYHGGRLGAKPSGPTATSSSPAPGIAPHQRPQANIGTLQEVDVATRNQETSKQPKPTRVRLGPDGKPWRSRRPRRTSEDLKRDALVESLLQEHGLNAFDNSEMVSGPGTGMGTGTADGRAAFAPGADEDADERAEAEFRRQFLEAATERREAASVNQPKAKNAAVSEIAGGPKLGGSRSQRARMHALEAEREKEKKLGKR